METTDKKITEFDEKDIDIAIKGSREKMRVTIRNVSIMTFIVFVLTISILLVFGIDTVTVSSIMLFTMLYFFPTVTFFLGMAIVWRKKYVVNEEE